MNIAALKRALDLSKKGGNIKSKLVLLVIGVRIQTYTWKKMKLFLNSISSLLSKNGVFNISIKWQQKKVDCIIRKDNISDYQSLFECFGDMYKTPGNEFKYLLDGGANIGFFSINCFIKNPGIAAIVCVEPNPENVTILVNNTRQLPAQVIDAAISDFTGTATFNFKEHNTGHLSGSPGHEYFHEQTTVKCMQVIDLFPPSWDLKKTMLKLDIEGQEYKVFRDMFKAGIFPQYITAELHDFLNAGGEEMITVFKDHGYEVLVEGFGMEGNVCRQIFANRKS